MGENTKIEWCTHTFNPWIGCSHVHAGCTNCYAEELMDGRYKKASWGVHGTRVLTVPTNWAKPIKWNREAAKTGTRAKIFCASLADVFEDWKGPIQNAAGEKLYPVDGKFIPLKPGEPATLDDVRASLFRLIDATPNLDWLLLTKRPENIRKMWPVMHGAKVIFPGMPGPLGQPQPCVISNACRENVWIGASVSDQATYDKLSPHLEACRDLSPVLFLSAEPLLGFIDFDFACERREMSCIDWVIAGGESGGRARPMNPDWIRFIRNQCDAAGVPMFFKQGSQANWPDFKSFESFPSALQVREFPEVD